eukprot:scaffold182512_cov42-Attheya_sp.AAC.1
MSIESNQEMLSELDSFSCDLSFIRDLDESPIDDILMPMMDDSELESILEDIMDMDEDDTLQQDPTNSLDVQNDVIDLSMDEPDEDEIPSFDWDTSCSNLSFNDPNMNDTTRPRDTIQMMLDSEQYSFNRIDMNDVQKDGITIKQRDAVAEWIFKVMDFYGGNKQCAVLAMSYMDRFLQQHSVHKMDIALVSACSLLIAAKENKEFKNNNGVEAMLNLMAPRGGFRKHTVKSMELRILESTDWMLPPPTPFEFGREFVHMVFKGETHTIPHDATICQLLDHIKFLCELAACDYKFTLYRPSRVAIGAILVSLDHKNHTNITGKQRRNLRAQIEEKMGVTITRDNGYDSDIWMCETNLDMAFEKHSSTMRASRHAQMPKHISWRKDNNPEPMHLSAKYCKRSRSDVLSHRTATETPSKKSRAWPGLPVVSPTPMKPKKMI